MTNQGWKDSSDSIRFRNGKIAQSPIALVEVKGYKILALRRVSELARHMGNIKFSQNLDSQSNRLEERLIAYYWIKGRSFFAEALDR